MDSDWCRDTSTKRKSPRYSEDDTKAFFFMDQSKQISTSAEDRVKLTQILKGGQGRGNVLDVGMLLEPTSDTYMGVGYTILDKASKSAEPLNHKIKGPENKRESYAVWNDMPDFCHCCHADDHVFDNCSERVTGEIYPEPVFENKIDAKEEEAYNNCILFILKMERRSVNITVSSNANIVYFKLKRNTQLRKLMEVYCERMDRSLDIIRFIYDGRNVLSYKTPDGLEMKFCDNIDVMIEQRS